MNYFTIGIIVSVCLLIFALVSKQKWRLIQWTGRGILHIVLGLFLLYCANVIGSFFEFSIPFNLITLGVTTLLGIPGLITLIAIKLFIV